MEESGGYVCSKKPKSSGFFVLFVTGEPKLRSRASHTRRFRHGTSRISHDLKVYVEREDVDIPIDRERPAGVCPCLQSCLSLVLRVRSAHEALGPCRDTASLGSKLPLGRRW